MKIWLASIFLAVLLILGLFGVGIWLFNSPPGTEWLLTRLATTQGARIGQINGTLGSQLQLSDLQVNWPGGQLTCGKISLSIKARQIFPLQLDIEQLQLEHMLIENHPAKRTEQPLSLNWPELPWWLGMIEIDLKQLNLVNMSYREKQDESFKIDQLQSQLDWKDQKLQLTQLALHNPEFVIEGQLSINLAMPAIQSKLQVHSLLPGTSWRQLSLITNLHNSEELLLFGPVSVSLQGHRDMQLNIAGDVGLDSEQLQFQNLRLQRSNRSGVLTATGSLHFGSPTLGLNSRLQVSNLDLHQETGQRIRLFGELEIAGNLDRYHGNFNLRNKAEQPLAVQLSGAFSGGQSRLQISNLRGAWLNGTINGQAKIDWERDWHVAAQFSGQNFDPHLLHDQLDGELNLDVKVDAKGTDQGASGHFNVQLNESTLHNQPITGAADLILSNHFLKIGELQLFGDGFQFKATGKLNEKISLSWRIERLEQLFSEYRGQVTGNGWFRLQPDALAAEFSIRGSELSVDGWQLANGQLHGNTLVDQSHWRLTFRGEQLTNPPSQLELESVNFEATGALDQHEIGLTLAHETASLRGTLHGGWSEQSWQGSLTQLIGKDAHLGSWQSLRATPLFLSKDQLQLGELEIVSIGHGTLLLEGYFIPQNKQAEGRIEWQKMNLGLLQPWMPGLELNGNSSGSILLQIKEEQILRGKLSLQGQIKNEKIDLNLQPSTWQIDWDNQGLQSRLKLLLADGSELEAQLSSPEKFSFSMPQQGNLQASGQKFSLSRAQPWLPPGLNLNGKLAWQVSAKKQVEHPWQVIGNASISDGRFSWLDDEETINAELSAATLNWAWQDRLTGTMELQLMEHGNIVFSLGLPISANIPLQLDRSGPISGELSARLQELGLLSVLFPGRVQESSGQVKIDLLLGGRLKHPTLNGDARLFDAGAFLPTLGITLKDIDLHSSFNENQVELNSLRLSSAGGSLTGQGRLQLDQWRPHSYRLLLKGDRFQLFNLPELQAQVTPDLTIEGDQASYRVRGRLIVDELLASSRKKTVLAENSPDLHIIDIDDPQPRRYKMVHDMDLQLVLGEQILFNSAGIDAKLVGHLQLKSNLRQELVAFGAIQVEKGKYASYGVSLDIDRGNFLFNGGPLDQPSLDILALRKAGEVQAGVKVSGTPKQPVVQLFSDPSMPETDILSYIVLGRPVGVGGNQTSLLMTAAGALLSQGESVALQEKLKNRFGLDVLDINTGDGDVNSSVITTGKYLSPDLYVSLGYSLFSNSNEVKVRYSLTSDWELESNIGIESGVDLFYKIDIQ